MKKQAKLTTLSPKRNPHPRCRPHALHGPPHVDRPPRRRPTAHHPKCSSHVQVLRMPLHRPPPITCPPSPHQLLPVRHKRHRRGLWTAPRLSPYLQRFARRQTLHLLLLFLVAVRILAHDGAPGKGAAAAAATSSHLGAGAGSTAGAAPVETPRPVVASKQWENLDSRHLGDECPGADEFLELVARGNVDKSVVRFGDVQEEVAALEEESDGVGGAEEDVGRGDAAGVRGSGEFDLWFGKEGG